MSGFRLRGLRINGVEYVHCGDLLLFLAALGERPDLNNSQRGLISAIMKDLREAKVTAIEENLDGEEV